MVLLRHGLHVGRAANTRLLCSGCLTVGAVGNGVFSGSYRDTRSPSPWGVGWEYRVEAGEAGTHRQRVDAVHRSLLSGMGLPALFFGAGEMSTNDQILALFWIIAFGEALGRIAWRGVSLGTSGVIFVALVAGHFGHEVPEVVGLLGLVSFLFCLGINAGPSFFRVFGQQGASLAVMGVAMILSAAGAAWLFGHLAGLPADLTVGVFAGALDEHAGVGSGLGGSPGRFAIGRGIRNCLHVRCLGCRPVRPTGTPLAAWVHGGTRRE